MYTREPARGGLQSLNDKTEIDEDSAVQPSMQSNPYTPPVASLGFGANEPQRYDFDVEVLESDVHRATRRLGRFVFGFIFLSFMTLLSTLTIIFNLRQGGTNALLILLPGCVLFAFLLARTTWLHLGPGAGRNRTRLTPLIVGHKYGTITETEIRISSMNGTSIHPLNSCCYADVRSDTLVFAFDQQRLLLCVLPQRAFAPGCFERAAKLLMQNALTSKVTPTAGVIDQRLLQSGKFFPIEMPTDGIAFSGPITTRDVLASSLKNQTNKLKWMFSGANVLLILFPLCLFIFLYDKLRLELGVVLVAIFAYLQFRLWRAYHANLNWTKSPEQILMQMRGVICDQTFHAATSTGASVYRWEIFTQATIHENLINLALPGKLGHCVILIRNQFASNEDWSRAIEIIRSKSNLFPISSQASVLQ